MEPPQLTFERYLSFMKENPELHINVDSSVIVRKFHDDHKYPARFAPVVYVVDYSNGNYLYVDDSCMDLLGFSSGQIKSGGLETFMKSWHPDDYNIINKYVFPANLKFLKQVPTEKYPEIVFSYNYRMLNAIGEYKTIVQRSSYLPGTEPGKPLGAVGIVYDISHFKNDLNVVQTIEEAQYFDGRIAFKLLYKNVHFLDEIQKSPLSVRESEILRMIAAGKSSKVIAHHLHLSIFTVNNHRKNMLTKTNCSCAAEMIKFAILHDFI